MYSIYYIKNGFFSLTLWFLARNKRWLVDNSLLSKALCFALFFLLSWVVRGWGGVPFVPRVGATNYLYSQIKKWRIGRKSTFTPPRSCVPKRSKLEEEDVSHWMEKKSLAGIFAPTFSLLDLTPFMATLFNVSKRENLSRSFHAFHLWPLLETFGGSYNVHTKNVHSFIHRNGNYVNCPRCVHSICSGFLGAKDMSHSHLHHPGDWCIEIRAFQMQKKWKRNSSRFCVRHNEESLIRFRLPFRAKQAGKSDAARWDSSAVSFI